MFWRKRDKGFDNGGCYLQSLMSLDLWEPHGKDDALRYYGFIIDKLKIAIAADSQVDFILRPDLDDNTKNWCFFPLYVYRDELRQYRTIIVVRLRQANFSSDCQKRRRNTVVFRGVFGKNDGKFASKRAAKALAGNCAVLP